MKPEHPTIPYRPDIDGLRALAVLAVVGFHATPRFVPGGFVGVDVFFVISGFLISGILIAQLAGGGFSLADFYTRRVRRIFPALIVVLAACWIVGWFVLVRDEFSQLLEHVAASALFVPNIVLWREAGYFDVRSELKPLLHMWSLGIEEQFYLIWPPLLYVAWTRGLNLLSLAAAIIVASFATNIALTHGSAVAAFFLPHARMWELLVGGMLAYVDRLRRDDVDRAVNRIVFAPGRAPDASLVANIKAWSGMTLIVFAIAAFSRGLDFPGWWFGVPGLTGLAGMMGLDAGMVYPGVWAVFPTLGTALVIWAGADAWINRTLLSRRVMVGIGLISYPLYLWHWPLLSFLQITESGTPSRRLRAAAVALSFLLAWITYAAVERPIRRAVSRRTPYRVVAVGATLAAIALAAAVGVRTGFAPRTAHFSVSGNPRTAGAYENAGCRQRFTPAGEYCHEYDPGKPASTALLGDSHAEHFLPGLGKVLADRGEGVVHFGDSGCPPLFDIERYVEGRHSTCQADYAAVLRYVGEHAQLRRVVLAFRGAADVSGSGFGRLDNEEGAASYRLAGTALSAPDSIAQALRRTVDYFLDRQKEIWIVLQVPELGFRISECVGRPFSFEKRVRRPCAVARAEVDARQAVYRQIVSDLRRQLPALKVFDPMTALCDARWCYGVIDGNVLYEDSNHLSPIGSAFVAETLDFR